MIEGILDSVLPTFVRPERLVTLPASAITDSFDWWPLAERLAATVGAPLLAEDVEAARRPRARRADGRPLPRRPLPGGPSWTSSCRPGGRDLRHWHAGRSAATIRPRPRASREEIADDRPAGGGALALGGVVVVGALAYAGAELDAVRQGLARRGRTAVRSRTGSPRFADYTPASFGTAGISDAFTAGDFDTAPYAMPDYQEVRFESRDGVSLAAWWVPADRPDAAAVILVHGKGSCRHDPVILLPAGMLHRNGFAVLLVDIRDMGDSRGARRALLRRDAGVHGRAGRLGLAAGSRPAGRSDRASSANRTAPPPSSSPPARSRASPRPGRTAATRTRRRSSGRRSATRASRRSSRSARRRGLGSTGSTSTSTARSTPSPRSGRRRLAIVHGISDDRVQPHHALDFARAREATVGKTGPDVEPWLVPGAEHVQAAFAAPEEYERRVVAFFTDALGDPGTP